MIRFGLCCLFREQPIRFRRATAAYLSAFTAKARVQYLGDICRFNAQSLMAALEYCNRSGIGSFRINSQILPLKTHPECGYEVPDLPGGSDIVALFESCGRFCKTHDIRTTFHPDQFIVLSSPNPEVVRKSVLELLYQNEMADWVGADVINIHAGGAYGDKGAALSRLAREIVRLPSSLRTRLTLENDDRSYTPQDLLPFCKEISVPFVYDRHHHRCLPDGLMTEEVTSLALSTWNREPLFHISSPLNPPGKGDCRPHHDYVLPEDVPECWRGLDITMEVEAKAKELAVLKLKEDLAGGSSST